MNIFEAIEAGVHDEDLEQIIKACKDRQKLIPLELGDKVKVSDNCSPKYMQGVTGVITQLAKVKKGEPVYLVKVDPQWEWKLAGTKMVYYSQGEYKMKDINMPRSLIAKVSSDD